MKTKLFILSIGIMAVTAAAFILVQYSEPQKDHYYPEELELKWTNDKIIQNSDVITLGQIVNYNDSEWSVETFYVTMKGNVEQSIIKVQTPIKGNTEFPQVNQTYIWFLIRDGDKYRLTEKNGIVDGSYGHSIREAIAKPTILNSIENKKINLSDPTVPKTQDGLVDYHQLIPIVSKPVFVDLFSEIGITIHEDDIELMRGPWILMYTEFSSMCGYVISDDKVYWLQTDLRQDTLTKVSILSKNPDPCKPSYGSCFCDAQHSVAEKTITELSYFDESEEAYVGQTFQAYLNEGNKIVNMPKKFLVGDYNFELDSGETTFCGAFVTDRKGKFGSDRIIREDVVAFRYFSGVIKNDTVVSFSLEEPMKTCAINPDAKVYDFK